MSLHRVYAVILRFLYLFRTNLDRWAEVFVFPTVDILLWGMASSFFEKLAEPGEISGALFVFSIVTGIIFWIIVYRVQMEIPMDILEELWNKSLLNLFCSPLKFCEWIAAFLSLGIIKTGISALVSSALAFILYKVNILNYGLKLIPFLALLLLSAWWLGFFVAGLILRLGTSFQAFAWTLGIILAPFSAIYYPVSALPGWAQTISAALPTSYIFEGMRGVVHTGALDWSKVWASLALSLLYLVLAGLFLKANFNKRLERGLLSLE